MPRLNPDDYKPMPLPTRTDSPRTFYGSKSGSTKGVAKGASSFATRIRKKRKKKFSGGLLGKDKGMYRKTDAGYRKRRFTLEQRQTFRSKRGDTFGGPDSGRPKP